MKLQTSKSHMEKIIFNSKIFQTIKIPESRKRITEMQKYLSNLKNSVKLLDQSKSKDKEKQKLSFHPSRSVLLKIKSLDKRKLSYNYVSNRLNKNESINDESKTYDKSNIKPRLYTNKLTFMKEKNKSILNKILKHRGKSKDIMTKSSEEKVSSSDNNETFVTSFDFSGVKEKNYNSEVVISEFNKNNKRKSRNRNYFNSLPKIDSKSTREGNTLETSNSRNRINSHIMRTNNSFDIKREPKKFLTKDDNTNIKITDENPINILDKKKSKDNIPNLNKRLTSLFGYDFRNSIPSSPEIANFIKRIKSLKNNISRKKNEYELDKWIMSSKMKYAKWKFGIYDLEKYFMDVDELCIKQKNEIELRKSLNKKLDLLIDDIKEEQEIKRIKERDKIYGINTKKEEKKAKKHNEYWIYEKAGEIMREQSNFLKIIKQRKIKEQKNRDIIESLLIKSKQRAFNINNS